MTDTIDDTEHLTPDVPSDPPKPGPPAHRPQARLSQGDVDKAVQSKLKEFSDEYETLKADAARATELEQRIAQIEQEQRALDARAVAYRIATAHGISTADADLFMTSSDPDVIERQAIRLASYGLNRPGSGNRAPAEGRTTSARKPGSVFGSSNLF